MTNQQALKQLTRARIDMIASQVFFGALALRLVLKEDTTAPTLWVDGKTVGYNPDFVLTLSHEMTVAALAHEVGHCILDHISRRNGRNQNKWNRACDYVINAMLKSAGFRLGTDWLYNPAYAGMSSEAVYALLPDQAGDDEQGLCEVRDARGDELAPDEWKMATAMAANAARRAGEMNSAVERFIDQVLNPKADWRTILRRFCTETTKDDYSWSRPNKYFVSSGVYIPSLYSEGMGELVVAIDTSGSITKEMLDIFGSEVQAVRDAARPTMTRIIYCDARINHVDEFGPDDTVELKAYGGGGTDFRPPFELVDAEGWRPAAFLYLTDLYGAAPEAPPSYPVLWCCTTDESEPWGERVTIEV